MLASKVDALVQRCDKLGTPSLGSQVRSSSGAMLKLGHYVRYVAFKATLLLNVILLTREFSMPMPCKTSTLDHKITPTQRHITQVGEITQIYPTETTTAFFSMPLNLNPQVFNTGPHITHLLNNHLLCPSPMWKVSWSAL